MRDEENKPVIFERKVHRRIFDFELRTNREIEELRRLKWAGHARRSYRVGHELGTERKKSRSRQQ